MTMTSMLKIASALGLRAQLVIDAKFTRKMQAQLTTKRDDKRVHSRRPPKIGPSNSRELSDPQRQNWAAAAASPHKCGTPATAH
jgi:hypothetical protein